MQKISVTIELEIDCEEERVEYIINEMDVECSFISIDESIGKQLYENNLIKNVSVINFDILKII